MAFTYTAIPTESLCYLRYYYFVRYWGQKVMVKIFNYNFPQAKRKDYSIHNLLKDSNVNLELGNEDNPFNPFEIEQLKTSKLESLDISIIFKISNALWNMDVNYPGRCLKKILKEIKNERNIASHEECLLSQEQLLKKVRNFNKILQRALHEAARLYSNKGANFDTLSIQIKDDIPHIQEKIREKYDLSKPEDIKRCEREVNTYLDDLHNLVLEKIMKDQKDDYEDRCKILPFDWIYHFEKIEPSKILVSLKMELERKLNPSIENKGSIILEKKDMLNMVPKVVILTGNAGSGKTTLLCSILEDWYKGKDDIENLSTFQTLLYMQFRSHAHDSFDEYLKDHLQRTVCDFNINNVKASILNSKSLILCDGYDESNEKSKKLFENFLKLNCKEIKIVVTTRPEMVQEITYIVDLSKFSSINLNLLNVSKENIHSHIVKVTNCLKTDEAERSKLILELQQSCKNMDNTAIKMLEKPLWLNLYILLYIQYPDNRGEINNATMLYIKFDEHKKKRMIKKLNIDKDKVSEFDKFFRKQSLRYYFKGKYELLQEDTEVFETKCQKLGLTFDSAMSTYFNIKYFKNGLEVVKVYCYRHKSEQEFAAAWSICDELEEYHNKNLIGNLRENGKNVIDHALASLDDICESEFHKYNRTYLIGSLTILITRILYNIDRKSLLYLIIDDLLESEIRHNNGHLVTFSSSISERGNSCLVPLRSFETLLWHSTETMNASEIVSALARLEIFVKKESALTFCDPFFFSSLSSFLSVLKPKKIDLHLLKKLNSIEHKHLISTLETANTYNIKVYLTSHLPLFEYSTCSKLFIEKKAKTCVKFSGSLTKEGIKDIPTCMEKLFTTVDFREIKTLSLRLQDLTNLRSLILRLFDDGSEDIRELTCLNNPVKKFTLHFSTNFAVMDGWSVHRMATVINKIWPPKSEGLSNPKHILFIKAKTSGFTANAVKQLGRKIRVKPLTIVIMNSGQEVLGAEMNLQDFYKEKGLNLICK